MEKTIALFDQYFIYKTDKNIIIRANLKYTGFEKFGYYMIYSIPAIFIWYIPINLLELPNGFIYIKHLLVIAAFILAFYYGNRFFAKIILKLERQKNTLIFGLEDDKLHTSDIKDIVILEGDSTGTGNYIYKLKFNLKDGEKTSLFAFTTYNKAKEIADLLKKEILTA